MNYSFSLKTICIIGLAGLILAPTLQAKPRTSVKGTLTREENPEEGTKNSLILPYAFSSDSMGFTLGAGSGTKGYLITTQTQVIEKNSWVLTL